MPSHWDRDDDEIGTYYGVVILSDVTRKDARWIMGAMEGMVEDKGSLAVSDVSQPDHYSVRFDDTEKPLSRTKVRGVLRDLDRIGSRPRPAGVANRLGVDLDADEEDE